MSKTVFDHLSESIDQVVRGRRFIIAEIGKLKVTVEDLKSALDSSSQGDLAATVNELKNFIQGAVTTLGNLKNSVAQLSSTITGLSGTVENTYNIVKNMKAGGGAPAASAPSYSAPSFSSPASSTPSFSAPSFSAPAPAAPSFAAPAPAAPAAAPSSGNKFDSIMSAARNGTAAKDLGGMIDNLRTELSKINPLDSKLFELSMEAGRLKSLGSKPLDGSALGTLEQKINKWKSQK